MAEEGKPEYIQAVPLEYLEEWVDNPIKRSKVSIHRLADSIQREGILSPLACIPKGKRYLIVDGNRRFRILRRLGIPTAPIILYRGRDPAELAIELNTTGRPWDWHTQAQLASRHPQITDRLDGAPRSHIYNGMKILGRKGFSEFIEENTLSYIDVGRRVAQYVGRDTSPAEVKKIIYWMARHRQNLRVRAAMTLGLSAAILTKAIDEDQPLNIDFSNI